MWIALFSPSQFSDLMDKGDYQTEIHLFCINLTNSAEMYSVFTREYV